MDFLLHFFKHRKLYPAFLIVCFYFVISTIQAQCNYSPVSASVYLSNECNGRQFQDLRGTPIPIYGNNGRLFFTSTLTPDIIVTKTDDIFFSNNMMIYPNPAIAILNIEWPNEGDLEVTILSTLGSEIKKYRIASNTISTLDISDLPPGYYTLISKAKNNQIFTNKLIKQ